MNISLIHLQNKPYSFTWRCHLQMNKPYSWTHMKFSRYFAEIWLSLILRRKYANEALFLKKLAVFKNNLLKCQMVLFIHIYNYFCKWKSLIHDYTFLQRENIERSTFIFKRLLHKMNKPYSWNHFHFCWRRTFQFFRICCE